MNWKQVFADAKRQLEEGNPCNFLIYRIPSGIYEVVIEGMTFNERTLEPKIPYFAIKMRITSGDFKGYSLSDIIGFGGDYASKGLARVMALASFLHIDISMATSPEDLVAILDVALRGSKGRVLAVKSRGQKAVINYLFDDQQIDYAETIETNEDFDYGDVPVFADSPVDNESSADTKSDASTNVDWDELPF